MEYRARCVRLAAWCWRRLGRQCVIGRGFPGYHLNSSNSDAVWHEYGYKEVMLIPQADVTRCEVLAFHCGVTGVELSNLGVYYTLIDA
jgi:hypothetical protein